ncbi:SDR family oxidoreductase [Patescibacteria group bacterium]
MDLPGKNILITGALGGLGSAFVEALHKENANLILTDNQDADLPNYHKVDFSDTLAITEFAKRLDKIDILINNAGVGFYKNIQDISYKEWYKTIDIDLNAPFILIKELLPKYIVNIGSGCSTKPIKGRVGYNTVKSALRGMSLSMSLDFEDITTIYFNLGSVLTNFGPMSKEDRDRRCEETGKCYLTPEKVAEFLINNIKSNEPGPEWILHPEGY